MATAQSAVVRKARSLRRRVARRWRIARSPRASFLDLNHDYRRTLLLVSSIRSGSTWLSDILEESLRCRMIFEPLRRDKVPVAASVPWGVYAAPGDADPELDDIMRRILSGRVRSRWSDKFNRYRIPRRRLVKEVRATNLLPRLAGQFPGMPVIYLLRHPIPTAWSAVQLQWKPYLKEFLRQPRFVDGPMAPFADVIAEVAAGDDPFQRHVLRWCLENWVPVNRLAPEAAHVVFYESIVEDPEGELDRLGRFLARYSAGGWTLAPERPSAVDLPSRANYRGTPVLAADERLQAWQREVPEKDVSGALEILAVFGLDRIYGPDIRPLVRPDEVLLGSPPTSGTGRRSDGAAASTGS